MDITIEKKIEILLLFLSQLFFCGYNKKIYYEANPSKAAMPTTQDTIPPPSSYVEEERKALITNALARLDEIGSEKGFEQGTAGWQLRRKQLLTASEASKCLKATHKALDSWLLRFKKDPVDYINPTKSCNAYGDIMDFINDKIGYSTFEGNEATNFGHRFEPVARSIYEFLKKTTVKEYGCIVHRNLPWLGASPDGVDLEGHILEIKCPSRRRPDGECRIEYYIQMQIQFEVLDFHETGYFMDNHFLELANRDIYDITSVNGERNFKGAFVRINCKQGIYPPPSIPFNGPEMANWAEQKCAELRAEHEHKMTKFTTDQPKNDFTTELPQVTYWWLPYFFLVPVTRDYKWFKDNKDDLKQAYDRAMFQKQRIEAAAASAKRAHSEPSSDIDEDQDQNKTVEADRIVFTMKKKKRKPIPLLIVAPPN